MCLPKASPERPAWRSFVEFASSGTEVPLCTADLKKKSGLKRVHAEFDAIYRKLDAAYEANPDERFRGGIIGIFTTMCIDSVLRNKVFERGTHDVRLECGFLTSRRNRVSG